MAANSNQIRSKMRVQGIWAGASVVAGSRSVGQRAAFWIEGVHANLHVADKSRQGLDRSIVGLGLKSQGRGGCSRCAPKRLAAREKGAGRIYICMYICMYIPTKPHARGLPNIDIERPTRRKPKGRETARSQNKENERSEGNEIWGWLGRFLHWVVFEG